MNQIIIVSVNISTFPCAQKLEVAYSAETSLSACIIKTQNIAVSVKLHKKLNIFPSCIIYKFSKIKVSPISPYFRSGLCYSAIPFWRTIFS